MACIAMRPIVDGLEAEFIDQMKVIRLDMQSATGKELGARYGFLATPTFVLLDGDGTVVFTRVGSLDPVEVQEFFSQ